MSTARVDVAIVDYGMGNLHSVNKALERVAPAGCRVRVTSQPEEVAAAGRVVFPGQGAMHDCMRELAACGLDEAVREAAANKPFLGICVGQQMLFDHSEEGDCAGLGILPGQVKRFADAPARKVPHMGWNELWPAREHPLWAGIAAGARFYFVHSYYVCPQQESDTAAHTEYGVRFAAAVARDNLFALQCHPEKSAADGLRLLENFLRWKP